MEHDKLCPQVLYPETYPMCLCIPLKRARADERAKARARVAGLPVERRSSRGVALVERVRVFALLDGGNDD